MAARSNSPATSHISNLTDLRDSQTVCSVIDSVSIDGAAEVFGKTTLNSEACHKVAVTDGLLGHKLPIQADIQDIRAYFARPRLISSFSVTASETSQLFTSITQQSLFTSFFPDGQSKLKGAFGVRYSLVFTLQSAHTPFQQGVYTLSFSPGSSVSFTKFNRNLIPYTSTNLPHVRLDLASDTMVVLKVPFVNTYDFVDPLNATEIYGDFAVNSILRTRAITGSALPTMKVYIHLEDVELVGVAPPTRTVATFQAGGVLVREQANASGLFSKPLDRLSSMLTFSTKFVPEFASFTAPASFFAKVMSGVASHFGYAKPISSAPPQPMRVDASAYENNVDLPAVMQVLAPTSDNCIVPSSDFAGSTFDELSLAYVLKKPCITFVSNFGTTKSHASILYSTLVSPSSFWLRTSTGTQISNLTLPLTTVVPAVDQAIMPTSLLYFGQMFRFWRGTIKFRITFSKTKFHAGRVLLTFIPYVDLVPNLPGVQQVGYTPEISSATWMQPQGYSQVFDLRDSSVTEFEVPYTSFAPYSRFFDNTGTFSMSVMDPLIVNASVANTVEFMVEVSAGDDFAFAAPVGMRLPLAEHAAALRLQSGGVMTTYKDDVAQFTTGELLTSLKQLLSIPHSHLMLPAGYTISADPNAAVTFSAKALVLDCMPWYYRPTSSTLSVVTAHRYSHQSAIAACYEYVSGSTDYHLYVDEKLSCRVQQYNNEFIPVSTTNTASLLSVPGSNLPLIAGASSGSSQSYHFRAPSYLAVKRIRSYIYGFFNWTSAWTYNLAFGQRKNWNISDVSMLSGAIDAVPYIVPRLIFKALHNSTTSNDSIIRVSAGDDAIAGYFLGPVPLFLPAISTNLRDNDVDLPSGSFAGLSPPDSSPFFAQVVGALSPPPNI